MEIRELRCFVTVAETLHFGRAADLIGVAQPPLSRTIAQFEARLGATLFERTSRRVALTVAGEALLPEARAILVAVGTAERSVRHAVSGGPRLVLAAKAGASTALLARLLEAYASTPDAVPVDVDLGDTQQARRQVLTGAADLAILHLPYDSTDGLNFDVLDVEGQVVLLPQDHPLARRNEVDASDLADPTEPPMARWPREDGTFADGRGAEVHSLTQLFQLVGLGRTLAQMPPSACVERPRDVIAVPVVGAAAVTTVIAWPESSRSRLTADFVRAATEPPAAATDDRHSAADVPRERAPKEVRERSVGPAIGARRPG